MCSTPVTGFAGTSPLRLGDKKRSVREDSHVGVPAHRLFAMIDWVTYPCYCRIHQYWADAFFEEMDRRKRGLTPRTVSGMTEEARQTRIGALEVELKALYSRRDAAHTAGMVEQKDAIERDLLFKVQELSTLVPGSHNALPPILLSASVTQWAQNQGMAMPPVSDKAIRDAEKDLDPEKLLATITQSPDYNHLTLDQSRAFADRAYANLQSYISHDEPLPMDSIQLISKIIPEARDFLQAQTGSAFAEESDPLEVMMLTRKRRVTRHHLNEEDTDDED